MKRRTHTIIALVVLFVTFGLSAFASSDNGYGFINGLIINALDKAQADGTISTQERKQIDSVLATGIVDEVVEAWVKSGYKASVAVDKAAEVSVREGWFKDKQTAKKHFRQSIEQARKDGQLFARIYQIMGV